MIANKWSLRYRVKFVTSKYGIHVIQSTQNNFIYTTTEKIFFYKKMKLFEGFSNNWLLSTDKGKQDNLT